MHSKVGKKLLAIFSILLAMLLLASCASLFYEVKSNIDEISDVYEIGDEKSEVIKRVESWIDDVSPTMSEVTTVNTGGGQYVARGIRGERDIMHNGKREVLEHSIIVEIENRALKLTLKPNGWHTEIPESMDEKEVVAEFYENEIRETFVSRVLR